MAGGVDPAQDRFVCDGHQPCARAPAPPRQRRRKRRFRSCPLSRIVCPVEPRIVRVVVQANDFDHFRHEIAPGGRTQGVGPFGPKRSRLPQRAALLHLLFGEEPTELAAVSWLPSWAEHSARLATPWHIAAGPKREAAIFAHTSPSASANRQTSELFSPSPRCSCALLLAPCTTWRQQGGNVQPRTRSPRLSAIQHGAVDQTQAHACDDGADGAKRTVYRLLRLGIDEVK